MTNSTLLLVAAILTIAVGFAHSILGEKFILMRLLRRPDLPKLLGDTTFTVRTLRFAWHLTTVAWWGLAAMLWLASRDHLSAENTLQVLAVTMLITSVTILVASRARHLAWPVFAAIGAIACYTSGLGGAAASPPPTASATDAPVLFVCEHGSVKSLMAAALFDAAAVQRGLRVRASSRGVAPDQTVPPAIVAAMAQDGFDVARFRPQGLSDQDIAGAARVIAIGVDLSAHASEARTPIEAWNDVPAASLDYPGARDDLARRIDTLLDEWQNTGTKSQ